MPVALAGKVTFFSGKFGGSDGRRPIDAKTKTPNENYVLCDGIETNGIAIPDLRGLMIVCTSDDHPMGETGGLIRQPSPWRGQSVTAPSPWSRCQRIRIIILTVPDSATADMQAAPPGSGRMRPQ